MNDYVISRDLYPNGRIRLVGYDRLEFGKMRTLPGMTKTDDGKIIEMGTMATSTTRLVKCALWRMQVDTDKIAQDRHGGGTCRSRNADRLSFDARYGSTIMGDPTAQLYMKVVGKVDPDLLWVRYDPDEPPACSAAERGIAIKTQLFWPHGSLNEIGEWDRTMA